MSELTEIVGDDVNLATETAPEGAQTENPSHEAQTEQVSEPAAQQEPDSRTVPLAALHEERQRRKELQQELARDREESARRNAIIEQRIAALTQAREQAQMPSFEENPAEHLRQQIGQVQQTSQQAAQQMQAWQQQQAQERAVAQLEAVARHHEAAFVQQAPDYDDAVNFLRNQRIAEMVADGVDEGQAEQAARNELRVLALTRAHAGQNPAEAAYKIAKARGYTPKAQAQAQAQPAERMQNLQRTASAAKTLGSGGAPNGKITAEVLASMSDDEFAEMTKGNNWQKIVGG